jgi:hypothetical protein
LTNAWNPPAPSATPSAKLAPDYRDAVRHRSGGACDRRVHARGVRDDESLALRGVALVDDDHCLGAGLLGVVGLGAEEAGAALDSAMSSSPLQSMPAKSAASQPLVEARSPVRLMSTG